MGGMLELISELPLVALRCNEVGNMRHYSLQCVC